MNKAPKIWWYIPASCLVLAAVVALLDSLVTPTGTWATTMQSGPLARIRPGRVAEFVWILLVGAAVQQTVIYWAMWYLRKWLNLMQGATKQGNMSVALIGLCEAILYPVALAADVPEFIGVWLAMKVAGAWKGWTGGDDNANDAELVTAKVRYNGFLIGSAMSLAGAGLVYLVLAICVL